MSWRASCCWSSSIAGLPFSRAIRIMGDIRRSHMRFQRRCIAPTLLALAMAILSLYCAGQAKPAAAFPPLEQWKAAVISGNVAALQALHSSNPPAQVATAAGASTLTSEVAFWTGLKARRLKITVVQSDSPQAGVQRLFLQAEFLSKAGPRGQPLDRKS